MLGCRASRDLHPQIGPLNATATVAAAPDSLAAVTADIAAETRRPTDPLARVALVYLAGGGVRARAGGAHRTARPGLLRGDIGSTGRHM